MLKPSKKTFYILIACILFVITLAIAKSQTSKNFGPIALETSSNDSEEIANTDDYNNEVVNPTNVNTQTKTFTEADGNLTESFSKGLFSKYYSGTESTGLSDIDSQALVNEAVGAYSSIGLGNAPQYIISDLKIVKSNEANIRNFANTFVKDEEACLAKIKIVAQTTEDPIEIGSLYKKCAENFITIPIIQEMNEYYLNLVNNYYLIGEKMASLEAAKSDPLKALVLFKEIGVLNTAKVPYYKNISNIIKNSGIIFSNTEPGKPWLSIPN